MPLNLGQRAVTDSGARFRVLCAGRRFGKTYLAMRELARFCRQPNKHAYYVTPTYRMARTIMWDEIKGRLIDMNWVHKTNESDLTIHLKNNSRISLRGADNFENLRGIGLDFLIMDEFAFIDERAWTTVLRPTLSDRNGSALFITTPIGKNWAYDLYQRGEDVNEHQWESFSYTTLQGGNVAPEEIEAARHELDERTFRQEYEASWEDLSNRVWYSYDRGLNVKSWEEAVPSNIYIGMDFNIDPMTMVVFARKDNVLHAIDEIVMYSSNTQEAVEEIHTRYPNNKVWVFPDPAARQRKTSAGGTTDLTILQNAGFIVKCPTKHNPVRDGINAVNSKLCNSLGERTLFVDPRCRRLIESLEKHTYKPGTSQPDKESGYDHMSDALRYCVDFLFPVTREYDTTALPQRWGHSIEAGRTQARILR